MVPKVFESLTFDCKYCCCITAVLNANKSRFNGLKSPFERGNSHTVINLPFNLDSRIPGVDTGWRPVVAAYQWWPFSLGTGNYVFVASQIRQVCKRKQKGIPTKKTGKIFCLVGKK